MSFLDLGPRSRLIAIPYKKRYNITEYLTVHAIFAIRRNQEICPSCSLLALPTAH